MTLINSFGWHNYFCADTAISGTDYNLVSSTLVFPTNSTNGTMQCMDIIIIEKDGNERNETFNIKLTVANPFVTLGTTEVNITIIDMDG